MRRAAATSPQRTAARRSSSALSSCRVTATVIAASRTGTHHPSNARVARKAPTTPAVSDNALWYYTSVRKSLRPNSSFPDRDSGGRTLR